MFVEFQKEHGEVAGCIQELHSGSIMPGLRRVKWELMSQLQVEPSTQLEVTVVIDMCIFMLLILMCIITEHLYLNKDMFLTLSH